MKYSELASKAAKLIVGLKERIHFDKARAVLAKGSAHARLKIARILGKIDLMRLLQALKAAPARAWGGAVKAFERIDFATIRPKLEKQALLAWEHLLSLRHMRFSADDPRLFWVSGAAFLIFQSLILHLLWRVDSPWAIFTHQLSFNADEFLVQRDNWGPEKVGFYLQHYWLDFFHPALYALFLRCLLTQIQLSFPTKYVYHSMAFPIAAAIYDEIENICQLSLMAGWTESKFVFYVGAFGSFAKWLLLAGVVAAALHAVSTHYWERKIEGR